MKESRVEEFSAKRWMRVHDGVQSGTMVYVMVASGKRASKGSKVRRKARGGVGFKTIVPGVEQ
jgi:hypothetical protein